MLYSILATVALLKIEQIKVRDAQLSVWYLDILYLQGYGKELAQIIPLAVNGMKVDWLEGGVNHATGTWTLACFMYMMELMAFDKRSSFQSALLQLHWTKAASKGFHFRQDFHVEIHVCACSGVWELFRKTKWVCTKRPPNKNQHRSSILTLLNHFSSVRRDKDKRLWTMVQKSPAEADQNPYFVAQKKLDLTL